MSLADFTSIIFNALSTVTRVPGLKPIFDGDWETATGETVRSVSSVILHSLTPFCVTEAIISLVTEAGYQGTGAFSASTTFPLSASTTSRASACSERGSARTAKTANPLNTDLRNNGQRNCTLQFRCFETRLEARRSCLTLRFQSSGAPLAWLPQSAANFGFGTLARLQTIPAKRSRTEVMDDKVNDEAG